MIDEILEKIAKLREKNTLEKENVEFVSREENQKKEENIDCEVPLMEKKTYVKPTLFSSENEEDFEEEFDDSDEFDSYNFEPEDDDLEKDLFEDQQEINELPNEKKVYEKPTILSQEDFTLEKKEESTEYVLDEITDETTTDFEERSEIILPNVLEESILQESISPKNLENESYDIEFEPKEVVEPIQATCNVKEVKEEKYTKEDVLQVEDFMPLKSKGYFPFVPFPIEYPSPKEVLPMPANDQNSFMPPVPTGSVVDTTPIVPLKEEALEKNPYFRSKKMNFHLKPVILTIALVVLFVGVFISIFAILHAFK